MILHTTPNPTHHHIWKYLSKFILALENNTLNLPVVLSAKLMLALANDMGGLEKTVYCPTVLILPSHTGSVRSGASSISVQDSPESVEND